MKGRAFWGLVHFKLGQGFSLELGFNPSFSMGAPILVEIGSETDPLAIATLVTPSSLLSLLTLCYSSLDFVLRVVGTQTQQDSHHHSALLAGQELRRLENR